MAQTVRWAYRGGFDAGAPPEYEVRHCREYAVLTQTDRLRAVCPTTLRGCGEGAGVADLQRALAHPTVMAVLGMNTPFFGENRSSTDIPYLEVSVDGRLVRIGGECTTPGCTAIPPGVRALKETLERLAADSMSRCTDAGAPPPDASQLAVRSFTYTRERAPCPDAGPCRERVTIAQDLSTTAETDGRTVSVSVASAPAGPALQRAFWIAREPYTLERIRDSAPCAAPPVTGPTERVELELADGVRHGREITRCWNVPFSGLREEVNVILTNAR